MDTASMGAEEDHLPKRFMAGLRTQHDQADTVTSLGTEHSIMSMAKASLASLSMNMEKSIRTIISMSEKKQVISWDRVETHSAQDTVITTSVEVINNGTPTTGLLDR